jgi:DnaK suppressor protein
MNIEYFKEMLLGKKAELETQIAILSEQTRGNAEPGVRDSGDAAVIDQGDAQTMESATVLTHTLEAVRDALQRIEEGTYGVCVIGGETIEEARLKAVPWTPYCRLHKEEADRREAEERNAVNREAAAVWRGGR